MITAGDVQSGNYIQFRKITKSFDSFSDDFYKSTIQRFEFQDAKPITFEIDFNKFSQRNLNVSLDIDGNETLLQSVLKCDKIVNITIHKNSSGDLPKELVLKKNLVVLTIHSDKVKFPPEMAQSRLHYLTIEGSSQVDFGNGMGFSAELTSLGLNRIGLTEVPSWVFTYPNLTDLRLRDNSLTSIPPAIGNLKKLNTFEVSKNRLRSFPDELGNCPLRSIHFTDNKFSEFPEVLCEITSLGNIYADKNELDSLPVSFNRLQSLYHLNVSHNYLTDVPAELCELPKLKVQYDGGKSQPTFKLVIPVLQRRYISDMEDHSSLQKKARQVARGLKTRDSIDGSRLFAESVEFARLKKLSIYFSVVEVEKKLTRLWYGTPDIWTYKKPTSFAKLKTFFLDLKKLTPIHIFYSQFILYIIFLALFNALMARNYTSYGLSYAWETQGIRDMVGSDDLMSITSVDDFWAYSQNTLANSFFNDNRDLIVGTPIIRQVRVSQERCHGNHLANHYIDDNHLVCAMPFSSSTEDRDGMVKGGITYQYAKADGYTYTSSLFNNYPAGGYFAAINATDATSAANFFAKLQAADWIDAQTSAVFVDFVVYNFNTDVMSVVTVVIEIPIGGSISPDLNIWTEKLFPYKVDGTLVVLLLLLVIFIGIEIYEISGIFRTKLERHYGYLRWWLVYDYVTDIWNWFEVVSHVLSLTVFIMHLASFSVANDLSFNPTSPSDYVKFLAFCTSRNKESDILAVLSILFYLILFKYLQVIEVVGVLFVIMVKMVQQLVLFILVFVVVLLGFGLAVTLEFKALLDFRTFAVSLSSLMRMVLGDANYDELLQQNKMFAFILVVIYSIIAIILLLNLLIAMLNDSYSLMRNAKDQYLLQKCNLIASFVPIVGKDEQAKFTRQKYFDENGKPKPIAPPVKKPENTNSLVEVPKSPIPRPGPPPPKPSPSLTAPQNNVKPTKEEDIELVVVSDQ